MRRPPVRSLIALAACSALGLGAVTLACGPYASYHRGPRCGDSVAELRRTGPAALATLLAEYDRTSNADLLPTIDAVAAQRDAVWSRLYWYTDLESAKAAAAAEHKPILALRMLGKLTDEYSCANSRFFRTALYSNKNVSQILRDRFILVWTSERPVPVATIDFGDGRVLKRTITGNSIHYILTPGGDVVDALPGLYDPDTFASLLNAAIPAAVAGTPEAIASHQEFALSKLDTDWYTLNAPEEPGYQVMPAAAAPNAREAGDRAFGKRMAEAPIVREVVQPAPQPAAPLARVAAPLARSKVEVERPLVNGFQSPAAPPARAAAPRAESKLQVERPLVNAFQPPAPPTPPAAAAAGLAVSKGRVESRMVDAFAPPPADADSDRWTTLAQRRRAMLDQQSINLIRSQNPSAYINPTALDLVVNNFQGAIAIDTLRNNQLFRRQILSWLVTAPSPMDALNTRVYAELFLTPRADPWLGLVPDSTYSALSSDGCSIH